MKKQAYSNLNELQFNLNVVTGTYFLSVETKEGNITRFKIFIK